MTIHFSSVFELIGWLVVLGVCGYIAFFIIGNLILWFITRDW